MGYTGCILIAKQKVLKERGIDKMLDEARADGKEDDAEFSRPSCECFSPSSPFRFSTLFSLPFLSFRS